MPLGAIASLGAGAMSAISNYFTNQRTNDTNIALQESANAANRQLAAEQRQWDLEMWNRQNAYNDPSAQMSRLRAAGINPALAYADGNMMNEAAPAQAAAGSRDAAARVQSYYLDPLMMAQVANLNAQTQKTETETDIQRTKLPYEIQQLKVGVDQINADIQAKYQSIQNMSAEQKLTEQKTITESFNRELADKRYQLDCEQVAQSIKESISREGLNNASKVVQDSISKLNGQKFDYLMRANALTLVGLQWDNEIKETLHQLNIDEHNINELNKEILGFEVNAGKLDDYYNKLEYQSRGTTTTTIVQCAKRAVRAVTGK